ncbi:MAG: glycosyltransferase 87 family protein [Acetobacter papayae]|uniref:glycosyltransferase family 39 protein n=1 Tax=Acetobacter papayae TaxID=1076592 RepID=UPI0039EA6C77
MKKISIILLSIMVLSLYAVLSFHIYAPFQSDYSEGWNASRQVMVLNKIPLYNAPPYFTATNYPPLWFYIVSTLTTLSGYSPNLIGRLASLASLLGLAVLAAQLTRNITDSYRSGIIAGLLFLLLYAIEVPVRVAENDPQPLGMALEMLGLILAISSREHDRRLYISAILFALSVFTKPNLIGIPTGVGIALLANRNWKNFVIWCAIGIVSAIFLYFIAVTHDGSYFFAHLFFPRVYSLQEAFHKDIRFILRRNAPFIALAAIWCWRYRANQNKRILISAWVFTHLFALYFSGGDGVDFNIYFECLWLDSVLAIISLSTFKKEWKIFNKSALKISILICTSVLVMRFSDCMASNIVKWRNITSDTEDYIRAENILHNIHGNIVCENLLMCINSGKPSIFDTYFLRSQIKKGLYPQDMMEKILSLPTTEAIEIGDTNIAPDPKYRYSRVSEGVRDFLPSHYEKIYQTPSIMIWIRKKEN